MCSLVSTMWYDVVGLKRRHGPSCWMATWLFAMLRAGALSWWVPIVWLAPWNPASLPKDGLGFSVHGYPHLDVVPGVPVLPCLGWTLHTAQKLDGEAIITMNNTHDIQWLNNNNDNQTKTMAQDGPITGGCIGTSSLIHSSHSSHSSQPRPSCCDHTLGHATYEVPKMTQLEVLRMVTVSVCCTADQLLSVPSQYEAQQRISWVVWEIFDISISWIPEALKRPNGLDNAHNLLRSSASAP